MEKQFIRTVTCTEDLKQFLVKAMVAHFAQKIRHEQGFKKLEVFELFGFLGCDTDRCLNHVIYSSFLRSSENAQTLCDLAWKGLVTGSKRYREFYKLILKYAKDLVDFTETNKSYPKDEDDDATNIIYPVLDINFAEFYSIMRFSNKPCYKLNEYGGDPTIFGKISATDYFIN